MVAPARLRLAARPVAAALLVLSLALAGCSGAGSDPPAAQAPAAPGGGATPDGPGPGGADGPGGATTMDIAGVVQTTAFQPVAGALVSVRGAARNATTGADGAFAFTGLEVATHLLDVAADGFEPQTLRVQPAARATLDVQLQPVATADVRVVPFEHRGNFQCALEALIVSGACDAVLTSDDTLGLDPVFSSQAAFEDPADVGWKTVVVDVVFDGAAHPGIDGLRVTVQGLRDQNELGTYEMYGRFYGQDAFTFRLEPGATYEEGQSAVPENATTFRFEVLPHSHAWHAVCAPPGSATCFLGAGAAVDVAFEMYVNVFYGEPASEGWSFRTA